MKIVSFTISQNEPLFEPLWRNYYSKVGDIVVFDPQKEPGLPKSLGSTIAEMQQIQFVTNTTQRLFNEGYNIVICPDVDEFIIPTNKSLKEFCEGFGDKYAKANGYTVVHQRNTEPKVDCKDPLKNRSVCYKSSEYCKTLLTTVPISYEQGRHAANISNKRIKEQPNEYLDLVHLKFIDFYLDYARLSDKCSRSEAIYKYASEEFEYVYDNGIGFDNTYRWYYWEGQSQPPKPHWRDALKIT